MTPERRAADTARRHVLKWSIGLAMAGFCPCHLLAGQRVALGHQICTLWASAAGMELEVASSTGEALLDRQLSLEANRLSSVFGFRPGLKVIEAPESLAANALATTDILVDGTDGTVLMGRTLVFQELKENRRGWGGLAVAGFMAHEFAHIYQFRTDYVKRLRRSSKTVEPQELHADFLAGYHLGLKRREGQAMDIGAFMDGAYLLGDHNSQSKQHHGTPPERRRAVRSGYRAGVEGDGPIAAVAERGFREVMAIMDQFS